MPNCIPIVLTSVRDCSSRTLSFDELLLVSFSATYNIKVRTRNNHLDEFKTTNKSKQNKITRLKSPITDLVQETAMFPELPRLTIP